MNDDTPARGGQPPTSHASGPAAGNLSEEAALAMLNSIDPEYLARLRNLGKQLGGKVVRNSAAGHSGYLLTFVDGDWVAAWLDPLASRMDFLVGDGDPPSTVTALLSNSTVADGSATLDVDRLYANEPNDIAAEAGHTHGKEVTGVAIGRRAFSLCFPEGMELEGTVFQGATGVTMLRVFWEQW